MLHSNVMAAEKPETVQIETLPDGKRRVILSRNFEEKRDEDGASWVGDQAVFTLEFDRTESKEESESGFDSLKCIRKPVEGTSVSLPVGHALNDLRGKSEEKMTSK